MTEKEIAHKYVHGLHDALTDSQEKIDNDVTITLCSNETFGFFAPPNFIKSGIITDYPLIRRLMSYRLKSIYISLYKTIKN